MRQLPDLQCGRLFIWVDNGVMSIEEYVLDL